MADAGGFVAVLVIDVHFPDAGSLKGKRKQLSSLKAQLRTRLGVAVAETGHQDLWQRSTLTAALVSGDMPTLDGAVARVVRWLEEQLPQGVSVERHVLSMEDLRG
ncbi:MAG TPA: DUF503 domain-containing protein [Conexibacter sp.]|nr:DUF503 domain-containing protein [Conexibacter sp.]